MNYLDDAQLTASVIRHCQITDGEDCHGKALKLAKKRGYVDSSDSLTYSGRTVAVMMLIDFNKYQKYFGVTEPPRPDFQHAAV